MQFVLSASLLLSLVVLYALALGAGCGPRGGQDRPALEASANAIGTRYSASQVTFLHPEIWVVATEVDTSRVDELVHTTVQGPRSELVLISQIRARVAVDLTGMLEEVAEASRRGLEADFGPKVGFEVDPPKPVHRNLFGRPAAGIESRFRFIVSGQPSSMLTQLFAVEVDDRTIVVRLRASEQDFAEAAAGFEQICSTLAPT